MKIALFQTSSSLYPEKNLSSLQEAAKEASAKKAEALFFPECFYSMPIGHQKTPYLVEKGNDHYEILRSLARDNRIAIIGGSAVTVSEGRIFNRAYNFSSCGEDLGTYDKMNLFACHLKDRTGEIFKTVDEGLLYEKGETPFCLDFNNFRIGESICFDLRFPSLYEYYDKSGCNILTVSSAFTQKTGEAHWQTLIRARAILSQSYVVAANQCGLLNDKNEVYGHSMIVDPWGEVLAMASNNKEELLFAELSLDKIKEVRDAIPLSRGL